MLNRTAVDSVIIFDDTVITFDDNVDLLVCAVPDDLHFTWYGGAAHRAAR